MNAPRSPLRLLTIALSLLLVSSTSFAGDSSDSPLPGFELVQFIASGALTPLDAMALDNNGGVLLACRDGKTMDELEDLGLAVPQSQLEFLRLMRMLQRDETGRWFTAFPVIGGEDAERLAEISSDLASAALLEVRSEVDGLRQALVASGLEDSGYAVFFSYVMDGMVWGFLEEYRRVPLRRLSTARPFWAGEIWALAESERERVTTSSIADRGMTLKVLSSSRSGDLIAQVLAERDAIKRALADFVASGRVVDTEAREALRSFGLVGEEGQFLVPVIDEIERDAVFLEAEKLTSDLVDWMLAEVDFEAQAKAFGFRHPGQALLVIYHEVMWRFMALLEAEGTVERPDALVGSAGPVAAELSDLVLIVDRARRSAPDQDEEAAASAGSGQDEPVEEEQ